MLLRLWAAALLIERFGWLYSGMCATIVGIGVRAVGPWPPLLFWKMLARKVEILFDTVWLLNKQPGIWKSFSIQYFNKHFTQTHRHTDTHTHKHICHLSSPSDDNSLSLSELWTRYATNKTLSAVWGHCDDGMYIHKKIQNVFWLLHVNHYRIWNDELNLLDDERNDHIFITKIFRNVMVQDAVPLVYSWNQPLLCSVISYQPFSGR